MLSTLDFECPPHLLERARQTRPVKMAVVGATDQLSMESARLATEQGLIEPYLVGDEKIIRQLAQTIEWEIADVRIINTRDETESAAVSTRLARDNEVGALMKGHVHTDTLMRAVINPEVGLRTQHRVSHAFYMTAPQREGSLVITDAAVNVAPTADQLMDILGNVVHMMHSLGNLNPRIAVLSATEQPSPAMPSSLVAEQVAQRAKDFVAGAIVEGPMALDNAISAEAAAIKGIDSAVAGRAEVLLVPNIETGNALFKAMVYMLSATAAGVVLGARVPIVLTSRADPPEARLASVALGAVISNYEESQ